MKFVHSPRAAAALALCVLSLPLASCSTPGAQESASPQPSRNITLTLAVPADPTGQAIGNVYADALERLGYTVKISKSSSAPYQQVAEGKADLAIDTAAQAVSLVPAAKPRGADGILSLQESADLVNTINQQDLGFTAAPLSAANAGKVMVLSAAEAAEYKIDSLPTLAAACTKVGFVDDVQPSSGLKTVLAEAGCDTPQFTTEKTEDLPDTLRTAVDQVVALQAQDALIGDEGFKTVDGSSQLFDAEPYMPLMGTAVDEDAAKGVKEVTRTLSQEAVIGLNRLVQGPDGVSPQDAAGRWKWLIDN
ncbi:glycine betaine ABC transporter substrate-binding protein [Glutamicibacter sp.]|uniref:glycine betaine ABC transporter substrate-binding protein n=1 Tax=Glutamicibacter sp. TaxID=1931995 RepID=UPI0028BD40A9|nr:glycine betaine ABC transporter substrate-binding protein [Glutamicibacter sp.]